MLADELRGLAVDVTDVRHTAVHAEGPLRDGYRMVIGSRVASRVLLSMVEIDADDDDQLYGALREVPWWTQFRATTTFAIASSKAPKSPFASHYWVQRAKDAIVDAFREHSGARPSVDKNEPGIRFHLHVGERTHELSLDFSGEAQHRRGYRRSGGKAPLKENLAAAILYLAGWPEAARRGLPLVDPTCGSGTFLAEAALMATHCAPGLLRERFGFEQWLGHEASELEAELEVAKAARMSECPAPIYGFDASDEALEAARQNLRAAGVESHVVLSVADLADVRAPGREGILVSNPPYGERLGDQGTLFLFYQMLGDTLKRAFGGWTAFVFAAHGANLKHLGLKPASRHLLYNGAIECRLLEIPIRGGDAVEGKGPAWRKPSEKAAMFANRIKKNKKKWGRWAKKHGIDAYRVYDADIPEFKVAVDRYPTKAIVHVFQKERDAEDAKAQQRVQDVILTLPEALGIEPADLVVKVRRKHDQGDQYARIAEDDAEIAVREGDLRFIVNLEDRIDTGLFLDHRQVRAYAKEHCEGKRMLNLFAYTCSVSVAAAFGGAKQTTSVDLSNTYLEWGRRNFRLNDLNPDRHRFFRNDATQWIARRRERYDWIFINPPTFSRSKGSKTPFNIHKDHKPLIENAMRMLDKGGELLFTTHARAFELDRSLNDRFQVEDATSRFVPPDFTRYPFKAFTFKGTGYPPKTPTITNP